MRYAKLTDLDKKSEHGPTVTELIMQGQAFAFLPFIHHSLLTFSTDIAAFVTEGGFDLYAKNDYRFMESVIKLLLTHFNYKASITIQQFFAVGFAEHKMILCRDICRLIREKNERITKEKQTKFKVVRHF